MEGLIPFLVRAIKKQNIHNHSFRCLSSGSRPSYQLLGSAGDSFNGSSHRRTQASSAMDMQPEVDQYIRAHNMEGDYMNAGNSKGLRQIHQNNGPAACNYNYQYGDKHGSTMINKFHQY